MSATNNILELAAIGRAAFGALFTQRLVKELVTLVILAVMTAMMSTVLIIALFYGAYFLLLQQGFSQQEASLVVGISTVIVTVFLATALTIRIKKMRRSLQPFSPVSGVGNSVQAFLDGLLEPTQK